MHFLTAHLFFDLLKYRHSSLWKEGEPVWSALHQLKNYLRSWDDFHIEVDVPEGVHIQNREFVAIGKRTIIEPGVLIRGPCIIGDDCTLRHGAYIREYVVMGDRCAIGHSAELKHSIFLNQAAVTHFAYAGDSIIGNRANLGAGVKCANLRLDLDEVTVRYEHFKLKSGLKKFGAIIGDDVQIGCNCVLNPGTILGKGSICHPLLNVGGYIPPHSFVKGARGPLIEVNRPTNV